MTLRHFLVTAAVAAVTACGASGPDEPIVATGTIEASEADLAFQLPGRITALEAREGDRVEAGQRLGQMDTTEIEARQRAAMAQVEVARALLAELQAGFRTQEVSQARLALEAAEQRRLEQARETARTVRLAEGGAVSQEARERAETALTLAGAEAARLAEQLSLLEGGSRVERIRAQQAQVAQAEATVAQLEAQRAQLTLVAPFAGIITLRLREPGEVVGAGAPVVRLMNPADRWVRIYVSQDRVGALSLGQRATLVTDAFPEQRFTGEVAMIASEAEFTPRNVQTREERVKLVHAVRIRILEDPGLVLKPGLAAEVELARPDA